MKKAKRPAARKAAAKAAGKKRKPIMRHGRDGVRASSKPEKRGDIPARVSKIDVETGRREVWKDLIPADPAGVERISNVLVAPGGQYYAYCYARLLSDLFVVEGLK